MAASTELESGEQPIQVTAPPSAPVNKFCIPAEIVSQHLKESGTSMIEYLYSLIGPASKLARHPISGYDVGAAVLGGSGNVYLGTNMEFKGVPLNQSVHAEQFALVNCIQHGESEVVSLAVSAAPCGHCRQFCCELVCADTMQFMYGEDHSPKKLADLLPGRFGPRDLITDEHFTHLMEQQNNPVTWSSEAAQQLTARAGDAVFCNAAEAALLQARKSYAPYTHAFSGAAIITHSGAVHAGGCIESAAYNPTLSAFHASVIASTIAGLPSYSEVQEVVLVEREGTEVRHAGIVELLLRCMAPAAVLTVLTIVKV